MLGIAITGLLAAFMAGVAANVTAFNTVVSYDLWQAYVRKDEPDEYYVGFGRIATEIGREVDYRPVETDGAARAAGLIAELL